MIIGSGLIAMAYLYKRTDKLMNEVLGAFGVFMILGSGLTYLGESTQLDIGFGTLVILGLFLALYLQLRIAFTLSIVFLASYFFYLANAYITLNTREDYLPIILIFVIIAVGYVGFYIDRKYMRVA